MCVLLRKFYFFKGFFFDVCLYSIFFADIGIDICELFIDVMVVFGFGRYIDYLDVIVFWGDNFSLSE